jgi:hypothetical protein
MNHHHEEGDAEQGRHKRLRTALTHAIGSWMPPLTLVLWSSAEPPQIHICGRKKQETSKPWR